MEMSIRHDFYSSRSYYSKIHKYTWTTWVQVLIWSLLIPNNKESISKTTEIS